MEVASPEEDQPPMAEEDEAPPPPPKEEAKPGMKLVEKTYVDPNGYFRRIHPAMRKNRRNKGKGWHVSIDPDGTEIHLHYTYAHFGALTHSVRSGSFIRA